MTIKEIKRAIQDGKKVYWANETYEVIQDCVGEYLIKCIPNNHCIGLHGKEGTEYEHHLNGDADKFFIAN